MKRNRFVALILAAIAIAAFVAGVTSYDDSNAFGYGLVCGGCMMLALIIFGKE